jgi:hypothetical protein
LQKLEHVFLNPHQFVGRKYWKLVNLKSAEYYNLLKALHLLETFV